MKNFKINQKEKSFSRGCPREALDVVMLNESRRLALRFDLLVGLGEGVRVDEIRLPVALAACVASVGDEAPLVSGLGRTPRSHNLDRFAERIRKRAAVALRRVYTVLVGGFVAAEKLLLGDDVLLAAGVGHDPISLTGFVHSLFRAAFKRGRDFFARRCRTSFHAALLLVDRCFGERARDFGRLSLHELELTLLRFHSRFSFFYMVCGLVRTVCYPNIYRSASQVRGYFYNYLVSKRIKKFSSPKMRNREFVIIPKIEYKLVAERSEANQNSLTFPTWCPGRESNSQGLRQRILSPSCIPFHHLGKIYDPIIIVKVAF